MSAKLMLSVVFLFIFPGCVTSPIDSQALYTFNSRISKLERETDKLKEKEKKHEFLSKVSANKFEGLTKKFKAVDSALKLLETKEREREIEKENEIVSLSFKEEKPKEFSDPLLLVGKTIWIVMSNGASMPVEFTIDNGRWVGPLGEYYNEEPTKTQIDNLYKK